MTLSKHDADAALAKALHDHAEAYEMRAENEMMDHYACIVQWAKPMDDGRNRYTVHFHTESTPYHVANGLFHTGLLMIQEER